MTLDPQLMTQNLQPARIGVFICECGEQVSDILDMEALVESASPLSGVAYAGCAPYWCSPDGRERLIAAIRDQGLERVVMAGCSPRTHRRLFQETAAQAGLSPDLLGLVNIREGCAWPHRREHQAATRRAQDQIAMEVAHMRLLTPRPPVQATITSQALVIGGGLAGMTAALELAQASMPVTLVQRAATLGGADLTDNPQRVTDLTVAVQAHPNITPHLSSRVTHIDGSVGAYQVEISCNAQSSHASQPKAVPNTFGAIIVATGLPDWETRELSRLLRLPQDAQGYIPELRVRLRPGDYVERGIYVCGAVHHPCDAAEAQFQAYSAASRALRHMRRGSVIAHGPLAQVDPEKCNGCADCSQVCPFAAVTMIERPDGLHPLPLQNTKAQPFKGLSLAVIDPLLCTGCGNCISVCPVGAVTLTGWADAQLEAQMRVALGAPLSPALSPQLLAPNPQPLALIFACEWSGYAAAELAGAQQLTYPPSVRMIRLDCSGRLQPGLILKAFEMGAAGVLVLGCPPRLCHYEQGNERAAAVCQQARALTGLLGLPPARFRLAWLAPDDGPACAELLTSFVKGAE